MCVCAGEPSAAGHVNSSLLEAEVADLRAEMQRAVADKKQIEQQYLEQVIAVSEPFQAMPGGGPAATAMTPRAGAVSVSSPLIACQAKWLVHKLQRSHAQNAAANHHPANRA